MHVLWQEEARQCSGIEVAALIAPLGPAQTILSMLETL